MRVMLLFLLLVVSFGVGASTQESLMYQADLHRTGYYNAEGIRQAPELKWKFDAGSAVFNTPLLSDGVVFFTSFEGKIFAVNADTGKLKWERDLGGQPSFKMAFDDGLLYVGRRFSRDDDESFLLALDADNGQEVWKFEPDDSSGMDNPTVYDGTVFFTSMSSNLFAVDARTGEEKWRRSISGGGGSPLIENGVLYYMDASQNIYALDPLQGSIIWQCDDMAYDGFNSTTPSIVDGSMYLVVNPAGGEVGDERKILSIDLKDGGCSNKIADVSFGSGSISGSNNTLFIGDDHGFMNAIDRSNGAYAWRFETAWVVRSSASFTDDAVYFGSEKFHAVDITSGEELWSYETQKGITGSAAIVGNRVYFSSIDGYVYALE